MPTTPQHSTSSPSSSFFPSGAPSISSSSSTLISSSSSSASSSSDAAAAATREGGDREPATTRTTRQENLPDFVSEPVTGSLLERERGESPSKQSQLDPATLQGAEEPSPPPHFAGSTSSVSTSETSQLQRPDHDSERAGDVKKAGEEATTTAAQPASVQHTASPSVSSSHSSTTSSFSSNPLPPTSPPLPYPSAGFALLPPAISTTLTTTTTGVQPPLRPQVPTAVPSSTLSTVSYSSGTPPCSLRTPNLAVPLYAPDRPTTTTVAPVVSSSWRQDVSRRAYNPPVSTLLRSQESHTGAPALTGPSVVVTHAYECGARPGSVLDRPASFFSEDSSGSSSYFEVIAPPGGAPGAGLLQEYRRPPRDRLPPRLPSEVASSSSTLSLPPPLTPEQRCLVAVPSLTSVMEDLQTTLTVVRQLLHSLNEATFEIVYMGMLEFCRPLFQTCSEITQATLDRVSQIVYERSLKLKEGRKLFARLVALLSHEQFQMHAARTQECPHCRSAVPAALFRHMVADRIRTQFYSVVHLSELPERIRLFVSCYNRRRHERNIQLMGHMYRWRQLPTAAIHEVIHELFHPSNVSIPHDQCIRLLCSILEIAGPDLDLDPTSRPMMDRYVAELAAVGATPGQLPPLRRLISNLQTLRARGWTRVVRTTPAAAPASVPIPLPLVRPLASTLPTSSS